LNSFGGLDINNNGVAQKFTTMLPKNWEQLILKGIGGHEQTFEVE
jgi:hypothetical protein